MISGVADLPNRQYAPGRVEPPPGDLSELQALASRCFEATDKPICLLHWPVRAVPPESWLARLKEDNNCVWAPHAGQPVVCGAGIAAELHASGPERFTSIADESKRFWSKVETIACGHLPFAWEPRLLGGAAFSDSGCTSTHWRAFGTARFTLPRVTYVVRGKDALLCLALKRDDWTVGQQSSQHSLLARALESLQCGGEDPLVDAPSPSVAAASLEDHAAYKLRVEDIVSRISQGQADKIVTAREERYNCPQRIDSLATVFALRAQAPHCTRFAFQRGHHAFLGATPETLVRRHGIELSTEALAGTIGDDSQQAEQTLLNSRKDRLEHQWVIAAIEQGLLPHCSRISRPETPTVRRLRHLLHLCTPVRATLKRNVHILALAQVLHPSPAVGGVPTPVAQEWIAAHEPFDRGWYSGVVGWFDRDGNGELNVALRSGFVDDEGIRLYAGAGIVRDSNPDAELRETSLKLTSLRAALRCHRHAPVQPRPPAPGER